MIFFKQICKKKKMHISIRDVWQKGFCIMQLQEPPGGLGGKNNSQTLLASEENKDSMIMKSKNPTMRNALKTTVC